MLTTISFICSIIALVSATIAAVKLFKIEKDTYIADFENLEIYDDLQDRILQLEAGINAHVVNIRELETKVSGLKTEVELLTRSVNNVTTTANNLIPFVDKTRSIAEQNEKRLNHIQGVNSLKGE